MKTLKSKIQDNQNEINLKIELEIYIDKIMKLND